MLCAYNHIPADAENNRKGTFDIIKDEETGMYFKRFSTGICLNICPLEDLPAMYEKQLQYDYVCVGSHEQYFNEEYMNYQPDTKEKFHSMAKFFHDNGYEFFFVDEIIK